MFSDIRDFTPLAESQPPEETIELLNTYYTLMFDAISGHGGVVTQMIGDGLMAIFGAPLPLPDHEASAVRAALEMIELIELFSVERVAAGKPAIRIGIGIASGAMVAGYTGTNQRATYTCIGDTVNLAARLEAHTKPRAARNPDRRRHARRRGRSVRIRAARPRPLQGQGQRRRGVFGRNRNAALSVPARSRRTRWVQSLIQFKGIRHGACYAALAGRVCGRTAAAEGRGRSPALNGAARGCSNGDLTIS